MEKIKRHLSEAHKEKIRQSHLNKHYEKVFCPYCNKLFSISGIKNHISIKHEKTRIAPMFEKEPWNKGLTKETDERVKKSAELILKAINSENFVPYFKDKHLSINHKQKISESMKLAHEEGRAWNIGKSRWNNEQSYPEIFFEKVINNEFENKEYIKEYPISIWSYDFAWPKIKRLIEIDGEQHKRFEIYQERDIKKDNYAKTLGWKILRIEWKEIFKDTKKWINIAKTFIDNIENIKNLEIPCSNCNLQTDIFIPKNLKPKFKKPLIKQRLLNKQKYEQIQKEKIPVLLNSGIDFSKYGWVSKASKILNIHQQKVNFWMKRFLPEFYEKECFKRIKQ